MIVVTACSGQREPDFRSNFATIRIEADRIVDGATGKDYSGRLVARDAEVVPIANLVLRGTPMEKPASSMRTGGLILVLPVEHGVPSGRATLHLDLRSTKLDTDVAKFRSEIALAAAKKLIPTIKVAEASFEAGKLSGDAVLLAPGPKSRKLAEARFQEVRARTTYVAGVQSGPLEVFYADGKRRETGAFTQGKQVGPHKKWWRNGRPALDATWTDGVRTGDYKRWYANGKPWEQATYVAAQLHGPYKKWWSNGAIAHDYRYETGKLHGDYRTFYDTGAKWAVGSYQRGKAQGKLMRWFPDGYVERTFRRYLECGVLAHGFARVVCDRCKHEYLA